MFSIIRVCVSVCVCLSLSLSLSLCVCVCVCTTNIKYAHYSPDRPIKSPPPASRSNFRVQGCHRMIFMLAPTFTFANSNLRECDAASCFLRRVGAEREREKVHQERQLHDGGSQGADFAAHHTAYVARAFPILLHTHAMSNNSHLHTRWMIHSLSLLYI